MTKLLISLFIKHEENCDNHTREKYGILASIVGAVINTLLFLIKFIIGMALNSVSIMADSFNNLSDSLTNIVSFVGIKIGNKPADSEHPFGHGRAEYFATFIISFFILFVGFEFLRNSIASILNPEKVYFNTSLIGILILTTLAKVWLVIFNKKIGTKIDSKIILAAAQDSRNDVFIGIATIVSVVFTYLTGVIIDGYIGIFVSFILLRSGYEIAKETLSKLMGESIDIELAQKIKAIAESYTEVLGTHDLIVHNYGPNNNMATIHVEVSNEMCISEAHSIIDKIERQVKQYLDINLVIHVDPVSLTDDRIKEIKAMVLSYINTIDKSLEAHHFKILETKGYTDVSFELVFPYNYVKEKEGETIANVSNMVKSLNNKYNCIIEPKYKYIKDDNA